MRVFRLGCPGRALAIKKSRFTEQQIAFALQQAEGGTSVEEVCRKMGIRQATFFRWKKVYGGLMPSEVRRLKQLEEENARLRKLVADLTLDKEMLTEVIKKRFNGDTRTRDDRLRADVLSGFDPSSL
jgi:putative transposase